MHQESKFGTASARTTHKGTRTFLPFAPVLPPFQLPTLEQQIRAFTLRNRRVDILAAFEHRVTWGAIRHWMKGRRKMPAWAIDIILTRYRECLELLAEMDKQREQTKREAQHRLALCRLERAQKKTAADLGDR